MNSQNKSDKLKETPDDMLSLVILKEQCLEIKDIKTLTENNIEVIFEAIVFWSCNNDR